MILCFEGKVVVMAMDNVAFVDGSREETEECWLRVRYGPGDDGTASCPVPDNEPEIITKQQRSKDPKMTFLYPLDTKLSGPFCQYLLMIGCYRVVSKSEISKSYPTFGNKTPIIFLRNVDFAKSANWKMEIGTQSLVKYNEKQVVGTHVL